MKQILLIFLLSFLPIQAFAFDEIEFRSLYDQFTLKKIGSQYFFKNQEVDLGTFKEFLPLFVQGFSGTCESTSKLKPDLTVKLITAPSVPPQEPPEKVPTLQFFIKNKIASDGTGCASVNGDGIYYVPLHSSWFEKNKAAALNLGTNLTFEKKGKVFAKIKKQNDVWVDDADGQFLNWDFFDAYIKSLESFSIDARLHIAAGDKKTNFTVTSATEKYHFYKVGENLWAAKSGKSGWLLSSKSWAFWQNMDESMWANPFEAQLKIIFDKSKPIEEREKILSSMDNIWNSSVKRSFHKLFLDPEQDQKLKNVTLQILKKKPTVENLRVMIIALEQSLDVQFQSDLTKALRVRNPKGPIIQPEDEPAVRAEAVKTWIQWWQQIEKTL